MNTKAIRKSYENLSMFQRLALIDHAMSRDDLNEAQAIIKASPRKMYSQTDYCELLEDITRMRLCNLIVRLGYMMSFDFLMGFEVEKLINKSDSRYQKRISDDLRLSAYLYVRATDSWNVVNDELGLRKDFDDQIGAMLLTIDLFKSKDLVLRTVAFSEEEARQHIKGKTGRHEFKTVEDEIEAIREVLELNKV